MQTNSVANLNNLTPPPAAKGANKDDSPAFGQMLSREIADRQEAEPVQKSRDSQTSAPAQSRQDQNTAKSSADKAEKADKADKTEKSEKAEDGAEKAAGADGATNAASSVSAEMLALVNSFNLTPLQTDKPAATVATDPLAGNGKRAETLLTVADKLTTTATESKEAAPDEMQAKGRAPDLKADATTAAVSEITEDAARNIKPDAAFTKELHTALEIMPSGVQSLQQSTNVATQTAAAAVTAHIAPRVGTPAWDQAIGQRVVWMVNGEQQTAELTLNPPDLGPLKVVLHVSNAQADATFTAAQPEVRAALETAMPKLRDMLSEAGIQLGQASVNSGQPNQQSNGDPKSARSSNGQGGESENRNEVGSIARVMPAGTGRGLVDTFV